MKSSKSLTELLSINFISKFHIPPALNANIETSAALIENRISFEKYFGASHIIYVS